MTNESGRGAGVLLVEDDDATRLALRRDLTAHGYRVDAVSEGSHALERWAARRPDVVLLDLGLPDMDGVRVIRAIRREAATPILVLSARDAETTKVEALDLGADDYVTKPFVFEELLARVRARLRAGPEAGGTSLELRAGGVTLDVRTRRASTGDADVELTAKEFTLLETFLRHPGQVLSREQLLSHVWGYDFDPGSNIVDVYVGYLRKKLGSERFETVRGMGYRLKPSAT